MHFVIILFLLFDHNCSKLSRFFMCNKIKMQNIIWTSFIPDKIIKLEKILLLIFMLVTNEIFLVSQTLLFYNIQCCYVLTTCLKH